MEEKKNRCPLCNKRLVMKDGAPTCPDCGYRNPYGSGAQQSQTYDMQQSQTSDTQQPRTGYIGQQTYTQTSDTARVSGGTAQKQGSNPVAAIVIATVVVVILVVVGISVAFLAVRNAFSEALSTAYEESVGNGSADSRGDAHRESSAVASSQSGENPGVSHLTFYPPESELLQEFVSILFDKPAASVTRDDLNSVIGLSFYDVADTDVMAVDYVLADGTGGSCILSSSSYLDSADLRCFPMLQLLYMNGSLDWDTDWHGMTSLSILSCESSLSELAECMDVSQLTRLQLECGFMMSDFTGIEAYKNLEYLQVEGGYGLCSLEGLSSAPALKQFVLEEADSVEDFEELYSMSQLEYLSVESMGLRDAGFIREMPNLTGLELIGTSLKGIDAIADCSDTLKILRLRKNYSVEDYSVVFACTGLEELELYVNYDTSLGSMEMPDLSMLTGLKTLTLGNYDRLDNLKKLTWLENLTLNDVYVADETALEGLSNLRTLNLINMSVDPDFLKPVAGLTAIETIDLTDSFIWGDISPILELPGLVSLNMEDADFGLKLDTMPVCESLTELNMTGTTLHSLKEDGAWDYGANDDRISLADNTELFSHFPNLSALYVPGHDLENVDFAGELTQLIRLDISDNYITDLSPLAGLENLTMVVCENNPIHDRTGMENVVLVE